MALPEAPTQPEQEAAPQTIIPAATPKHRPLRPELIMGIIALFAAQKPEGQKDPEGLHGQCHIAHRYRQPATDAQDRHQHGTPGQYPYLIHIRPHAKTAGNPPVLSDGSKVLALRAIFSVEAHFLQILIMLHNTLACHQTGDALFFQGCSTGLQCGNQCLIDFFTQQLLCHNQFSLCCNFLPIISKTDRMATELKQRLILRSQREYRSTEWYNAAIVSRLNS